MSATNTTTNLGLSQFVNTDVPAWRQDYNGDMLKIDNAYTADISGATAETSADPSDYMKFYDVSATTNKKILISDLLKGAKVEDLTDTDITTPANNDGLVYDATAQKWENVPIMTKEQWKKNGAYNLLENTLVTEVDRGVTFTVNNGVVTLSGTSESAIYKRVKEWRVAFPSSLRTGEVYKLVGCPTNTSNVRLVIQENNNDIAYDSGNGATFTQQAWDNTKSSFVYIEIPSGKNVDGIVIKPMITTDLNATYDDFVPYAKTNRELTKEVAAVKSDMAYGCHKSTSAGSSTITVTATNQFQNFIVTASGGSNLMSLYMIYQSGANGTFSKKVDSISTGIDLTITHGTNTTFTITIPQYVHYNIFSTEKFTVS